MSAAGCPSKRFRSGERLSVRTRGLALTEQLHRVVRGCVSAATGRFQDQVRQLFVWIEDTNGPKGGNDMRCRMEVTLKRGGRFMATAAASNQYAAVGDAANRLRVRLVRSLAKRRRRRHVKAPLTLDA